MFARGYRRQPGESAGAGMEAVWRPRPSGRLGDTPGVRSASPLNCCGALGQNTTLRCRFGTYTTGHLQSRLECANLWYISDNL